MLFTKKSSCIMTFIMCLMLVSCASVPTKELSDAEKAIRESEKVNSGKFAPQELQLAKNHLNTAKSQVDKSKNEEAKASALKAKNIGDTAYFKALAEFMNAQKEGTQKSKEDAKASHADKLVPEKYQEAVKLYDEVQKDMEKVKVRSAQLRSLQTPVE